MLETFEQIEQALNVAGETISFDKGTFKAIPGQVVYNIPSYDSPYDVNKQDISFRTALKYIKDYEILPEETFIYKIESLATEYTFKCKVFINDFTGWVQILCNLEGFEE